MQTASAVVVTIETATSIGIASAAAIGRVRTSLRGDHYSIIREGSPVVGPLFDGGQRLRGRRREIHVCLDVLCRDL